VCEFSGRQLRHTKYLFPSFFQGKIQRPSATFSQPVSQSRPPAITETYYNITFTIMNTLINSSRRYTSAAVHTLPKKPFVPVRCSICKTIVLCEVFSMSNRRSSPLNDFTLTSSVFLALYPPIGSIQEKLQTYLPLGSGHLPLDGSLVWRGLLHCRHDA
jgi:hypothetical protein